MIPFALCELCESWVEEAALNVHFDHCAGHPPKKNFGADPGTNRRSGERVPDGPASGHGGPGPT